MPRWLLFLYMCLLLLLPQPVTAHIGSPNVIFEGAAGPYPVRVIVKPPEVIPGLADIFVRVREGQPASVTVLPIRFDAGKAGAPSPDPALPVRGETNLFTAELWFMRDGAHSVEVGVSGAEGSGTVQVPVNAIATRTLSVPAALQVILIPLGGVLFFLAIGIVGGAVRQAVLPPGEMPSVSRRIWAGGGMAAAALVLGSMVWLGKAWWDAEDADYRNNRLFAPYSVDAKVLTDESQPVLRLTVTDERFRRGAPLVPDHGKLMHLFLVGDSESPAFAHLHPSRTQWDVFETALPPLPPGAYRVFADITHETGFSHTLASRVELAPAGTAGSRSGDADLRLQRDPDDSWLIPAPGANDDPGQSAGLPPGRVSPLNGDLRMVWHTVSKLTAETDTELRFSVLDRDGRRASLEPYMGMLAHAVVANREGTVFTHLHPSGSISMASQQLFELRAEGKAPDRIAFGEAEPICRLPTVKESEERWSQLYAPDGDYSLLIPYAFPRPGEYHLWVQVQVNGTVLTGAFEAEVEARGQSP